MNTEHYIYFETYNFVIDTNVQRDPKKHKPFSANGGCEVFSARISHIRLVCTISYPRTLSFYITYLCGVIIVFVHILGRTTVSINHTGWASQLGRRVYAKAFLWKKLLESLRCYLRLFSSRNPLLSPTRFVTVAPCDYPSKRNPSEKICRNNGRSQKRLFINRRLNEKSIERFLTAFTRQIQLYILYAYIKFNNRK